MNENRKPRRINWSSLIGWLIFGLVLLSGPLSGVVRRVLGTSLPPGLISLLPIAIGGLVLLSFIVSAVRAANQGRAAREQPWPNTPPTTSRPNAPIPPFGGPATPRMPPTPTVPNNPPLPPTTNPLTLPGTTQSVPDAPRFDPLIDPKLVVIGIVGLLLLGGLGLFWLGQGTP